jgi:hypothetical protein
MQVNIENFPISNLGSRFNIGRQALYNRLEALEIKPTKVGNRAYVTSHQLDKLDSLHEHIVAGGTMLEFTSELDTLDMSSGYAELDIVEESSGYASNMELMTQVIANAVVESIASTTPSNPIAYMDYLEKAIEKAWVLTTGEVRSLIGVQPKADRSGLYRRGGFVFRKAGKVGCQTGWTIERANSGNQPRDI